MENPEITNHAILYTDGSCGPVNPGNNWGCGVHGYIYPSDKLGVKSSDKPTSYYVTDIGYVEEKLITTVNAQHVTPTHYINGYSSFYTLGSNNTGEVMAVVLGLTELLKLTDNEKISNILIKTDSMYVIHIMDKLATNPDWRHRVEKNIQYWELLESLTNECNRREITIKIEKVLAHDTSLGNNTADRLAFLGRNNSCKYSKDNTVFTYTSSKKYWKPDIDRHPFLSFKQLFFLNGYSTSDNGIYSILNYKKDEEPGKKSHEANFGLVITNKQIPEIEHIKTLYQNKLGTLEVISTIDLNTLYSQKNIVNYNIFGDDIYTFGSRGKRYINVLEEEIICSEVSPPGLAKKAVEKVLLMDRYISEYRNIGKIETVTKFKDITDLIYGIDAKGKLVTIPTNNDKYITASYTTNAGKDIPIVLQLGKDLITRNQFAKLVKDEPVVTLVTIETHTQYVEYYVIVETKSNNDISIWCNIFGNGLFMGK